MCEIHTCLCTHIDMYLLSNNINIESWYQYVCTYIPYRESPATCSQSVSQSVSYIVRGETSARHMISLFNLDDFPIFSPLPEMPVGRWTLECGPERCAGIPLGTLHIPAWDSPLPAPEYTVHSMYILIYVCPWRVGARGTEQWRENVYVGRAQDRMRQGPSAVPHSCPVSWWSGSEAVKRVQSRTSKRGDRFSVQCIVTHALTAR